MPDVPLCTPNQLSFSSSSSCITDHPEINRHYALHDDTPPVVTESIPKKDDKAPFEVLIDLMTKLRGPEGCPWDKKQDHQSLKACLLEETYEVLDAIDQDNPQELQEELGDLLLQVVFHAQIARENRQFEIRDVIRSLNNKLIRRHPHVFADETVTQPEEAIRRWEQMKAKERPVDKSVLSGVPPALPALLRAYRLGAKASRMGFDWLKISDVLAKVEEELQEFYEEIKKLEVETIHTKEGKKEASAVESAAIEEELGDLLFALSQVARFLKINPEDSLRKSTQKFQRRFEFMEKKIKDMDLDFADVSMSRLEELWEEAKSYTETV